MVAGRADQALARLPVVVEGDLRAVAGVAHDPVDDGVLRDPAGVRVAPLAGLRPVAGATWQKNSMRSLVSEPRKTGSPELSRPRISPISVRVARSRSVSMPKWRVVEGREEERPAGPLVAEPDVGDRPPLVVEHRVDVAGLLHRQLVLAPRDLEADALVAQAGAGPDAVAGQLVAQHEVLVVLHLLHAEHVDALLADHPRGVAGAHRAGRHPAAPGGVLRTEHVERGDLDVVAATGGRVVLAALSLRGGSTERGKQARDQGRQDGDEDGGCAGGLGGQEGYDERWSGKASRDCNHSVTKRPIAALVGRRLPSARVSPGRRPARPRRRPPEGRRRRPRRGPPAPCEAAW